MIIGIDFDNTIANYTGVFYRVGCALGWLPESVGQSKNEVKQHFISQDNETRWTELQGIVYGKEISQAQPYPDCLETLRKWRKQGHTLKLISHKTRYPIIGERVDFHVAATRWLEDNGFVGTLDAPLEKSDLFFNETKEDKLLCISTLGCELFVDDLESIFNHDLFPAHCKKVLFNTRSDDPALAPVKFWSDIPDKL
ncbi:HAD family hydrolase [Pseudoalteromonas sp. McH1-42]|uniref:HAD family hydrolase n=1 Tax=Pseudoalteromonas sp. McH1-42 TaxID=2917752 RepID=UPI001EF73A60|nr:HAD family hydrolase [Pseudoalteromonas sp. McH1-42]MCG7563592.1 HAD family hydrolase [Pseudoalteromonas sp. McH1-42]